jgi:hypothetical protein
MCKLIAQFCVPLPPRMRCIDHFHVYWQAEGDPRWQLLPDECLTLRVKGLCFYVEAVIWPGIKPVAAVPVAATKVRPRTRSYKGRGDKEGNRAPGR